MPAVVDFVDDSDPRVLGNGIGSVVNGHEILRAVAKEGTGGLAGMVVEGTAEGDVGAPAPGCDFGGLGTYNVRIMFGR